MLNNLFPAPRHMLSTSRSFFIFPCMGLPNISTLLNGQTPWMPLTRLSYFTEGSYPPWAPSEPLLSLSTVLPSVEQDPLPVSHPRPTSPPGLCRPTPFCLVTPLLLASFFYPPHLCLYLLFLGNLLLILVLVNFCLSLVVSNDYIKTLNFSTTSHF